MTVHYLTGQAPSRVERLEALIAKGVAFEEALNLVNLTRYELLQELRALEPVTEPKPRKRQPALPPGPAKILAFPSHKQFKKTFVKSSLKRSKAKDVKKPARVPAFVQLGQVLSFPDVNGPSFNKKI